MRDKNNFTDEYDRDRDRGFRRDYRDQNSREDYRVREDYPREGYRTREGYYPATPREEFQDIRDRERERYYADRYSTRDPNEGRYDATNQQPLYEPRYGPTDYSSERERNPREITEGQRREYADRDRTKWGYTTQRSHVRCRDIMTRDVVACRPDSNLREVARLMRDEDAGSIPVLDEHNKVVGMVTDRDIVVRVLADLERTLDSSVVRDAMSTDIYSVRPNDRLVDCIRKMGDKQVRRILVTDDNERLKGIISMGDVATEAEYDRELAEAIEDISKPKSWFKRLFS
jgi:CBS domain-containing protein